jgi:hypothetical protein
VRTVTAGVMVVGWVGSHHAITQFRKITTVAHFLQIHQHISVELLNHDQIYYLLSIIICFKIYHYLMFSISCNILSTGDFVLKLRAPLSPFHPSCEQIIKILRD